MKANGTAVPQMRGPTRKTMERINALKTFLSVDEPISKRAALYRLLSMGLIDSTKDFHNVNRALNRALEQGIVTDEHFDDACFDDNRRLVETPTTWADPTELKETIQSMVLNYRRDLWQDQPRRVEVWLEKHTVAYLVRDITDKYGVTLRISSGNYSRTFLWRAARDLSGIGITVPLGILYIGDFDPSGLDIERAARRGSNGRDGIADFLEKDFNWEPGRFEKQVSWLRVGVTEGDYWSMPTKARVPLKDDEAAKAGTGKDKKKRGDPRAEEFKTKYGDYGVETEALEVLERNGLARRLEREIKSRIDNDTWNKSERQQERDRKLLAA